MSSAPVSSHIPDLDLITYCAERGSSFSSRLSPWTKALLLAALVVTVTITQNLAVLLGLYLVVLSLFALARLPLKRLFVWYFFPLLFVISLVGIMAWTQPGIPVISLAIAGIPLTLTDQGLLLVMTLSVKTLTAVTFTFFFLMTTRYEHLSAMISRVFPSPLDQIFLMAYRFFFLTLAMVGAILKAVRSRGGGLVRGILLQGALFAEVIGLVFIRSLDRAERVHRAMIARGYRGAYSNTTEIPVPNIAEAGALGICIMILAGVLAVASPGWW